LNASGHGKVGVEFDLVTLPLVAVGNSAKKGDGVEDLVVKGEVVGWDDVNALRLLQLPVGFS